MNTTIKQMLLMLLSGALVLALMVTGCKKDEETVAPPTQSQPINTGNAKFTKYVSTGNSITAGFQSNALSGRDQVYGFPSLLAQHLSSADFQQPLIKEPGIGARQRLQSLTGPVIVNEVGVDPTSPASNLKSALARPYNNLGIPGAILFDMLDQTDFGPKSVARGNPFFAQILRSQALGKSIVQQARALAPTFMTCWIGNNDVLGYATSGGLRGTNSTGTPGTLPTEAAIFTALYSQLLDSLKSIVDTNLVVANIPDVTSIPFFTTVGPSIKAALPAGIQFRYQKGTNRGVSFDSTRFADANAPLICLPGISYAPLLGRSTGKFYRDNNITTLPAGIDTTKPFGFHPQNPWPTALTLDVGEIAIAQSAVTAYNAAIASLTAARRIAVVDINTVLRSYATGTGVYYSGYGSFSSAFITGGLFSYDGVHPSSRGHVIIANEFIKVINTKFKATIPPIGFSAAPGIPIGKGVELSSGFDIGSVDFTLSVTQSGSR